MYLVTQLDSILLLHEPSNLSPLSVSKMISGAATRTLCGNDAAGRELALDTIRAPRSASISRPPSQFAHSNPL